VIRDAAVTRDERDGTAEAASLNVTLDQLSDPLQPGSTEFLRS